MVNILLMLLPEIFIGLYLFFYEKISDNLRRITIYILTGGSIIYCAYLAESISSGYGLLTFIHVFSLLILWIISVIRNTFTIDSKKKALIIAGTVIVCLILIIYFLL